MDTPKNNIAAVAQSTESGTYLRKLEPEEIQALRESVISQDIFIRNKKQELKDVSKEIKDEMKPVEESRQLALSEIETGHRSVKGTLYLVPNFETNQMEYFDSSWNLIKSRLLAPDERQLNIIPIASAQ